MSNGDQAFTGAIGGLAGGASTGNPWAAAAGLAGGALFGAFSPDYEGEWNDRVNELGKFFSQRQAMRMGPATLAQDSSLMGNRAQLISQLESAARGDGPSAARLQMKAAAERAAQMMSSNAQGAGGRGVNAGAAMRNAGNQAANIMQTNNQNMGIMRAQEQLNAYGQLGQVIGQGIGQDQQQSQFNAGAINQQHAFDVQTAMQQLGLNDRMQLAMLGLQYGKGPKPGWGDQIAAGAATMGPQLGQMFGGGQQQQQQGGGTNPWFSSSEGAPAGTNNVSHNVPFGTPYNTPIGQNY